MVGLALRGGFAAGNARPGRRCIVLVRAFGWRKCMSFSSSRGARMVFTGAVVLASIPLARAGDYYVDPNYGGVNGAPFGGYAAAYNSVAASAHVDGDAGRGFGQQSQQALFCPGDLQRGTASLSNSRSNIALIGLTGNADDVVITSTLDSAYNGGTGVIGTTGKRHAPARGEQYLGIQYYFCQFHGYAVHREHRPCSGKSHGIIRRRHRANQPTSRPWRCCCKETSRRFKTANSSATRIRSTPRVGVPILIIARSAEISISSLPTAPRCLTIPR